MKILVSIFLTILVAINSADAVLCQETKQILKVGAVLHLTGDLAMVSAAFREGIELAVENTNLNTKNHKLEIKLIIEDGQNNPKISNTAIQKLINQDQVNVLLLSSHIDAMSGGATIEKARVPSIVLWDSNPEIDALGKYIFAIGPWTPSAGEVASRFAIQKLQARTAVVITNSDAWSEAVGEYFSKDFEKRGGKIIDRIVLNATETDFRSVISKIKAINPDILYSPLVFNLVPFYSQLKKQKFGAPILSSDIIAEEHISKAPEAFEGVYQTGLLDPTSVEYQQVRELYKSKYNREIMLPWFVAVGYDSIGMILNATSSGSSILREAISQKIYKIKNYKGASSEISINEQGSSPQYEHMFRLLKGKFILVEQ